MTTLPSRGSGKWRGTQAPAELNKTQKSSGQPGETARIKQYQTCLSFSGFFEGAVAQRQVAALFDGKESG